MNIFRTIRGPVNRYHHHRRFMAALPPSAKPLSQFTTVGPTSSASSSRMSPLRRFLKFASLASLGTLGAVSYVTYAYSEKELCEKTKGFTSQYPRTLESSSSVCDVVFTPLLNVAVEWLNKYLSKKYVLDQIIDENRQCTSDRLLGDSKWFAFTLVLDLNDTLVHPAWKPAIRAEVDDVQPFQRPGLEAFLKHADEMDYEILLYTDELAYHVYLLLATSKHMYYFRELLTRRSTIKQDGKNYRDLSRLNRDPKRVLYVSAHALENCLQPENCVPIKPWNRDMEDTTLTDLQHFLDYVTIQRPEDVRQVLSPFNSEGKDIVTEFKNHQRSIREMEETRKADEQRKKERMVQKWQAMEEKRKMEKWE